MKRSEMEAAFTKIIKQYSSIKFKDAPELASRLITLAMNHGMSPPSMSLPTKAILKGKEINVGNITTIRIWEPEYTRSDSDEEK